MRVFRAIVLLAVAAALYGGHRTRDSGCEPGAPVALVGGDVLTMETAEALKGATVVVEGDRITAVGRDAPVPPGACRIDARGRTVLPGLVDMHVHTSERDLPLYLYNGVTTVREMNGSPDFVRLRERIAAGEVLGPRLIVASPLLAGVAQPYRHRLVTSPEDAWQAAREAKAAGYDYLKVYDGLSRESYDALVAAGAELGLPLDGHVPAAVGLERVLEAEQTIEHMDKIAFSLAGHDPDTSVVARARELFREHPVRVTPTIASLHALDIARTPAYDTAFRRPELAYIDSATLAWWGSLRGTRTRPPGPSPYYRLEIALLAALHAQGIPMLLGTDTGNPLMVPGFAVHEELERLVEDAGISRWDALRMATVNVGRFLHEPGTGTVAPDARADLLLVDGDPLSDLTVLREPVGVMAAGRWLDRAHLDSLLATMPTTPHRPDPDRRTDPKY